MANIIQSKIFMPILGFVHTTYSICQYCISFESKLLKNKQD